MKRDPARVIDDWMDGFMTAHQAKYGYGVDIDESAREERIKEE